MSSLDEYERLAVRLSSEPGLLNDLRHQLAESRPNVALFDTERAVRELEAAFVQMTEISRAREAPRSFSVSRA